MINDTSFDVAPDGSYEVTLGGPPQERNSMELPDDAGHLATRHYFELAEPAGADPTRVVPLTIERIGDDGRAAGPDRRVGGRGDPQGQQLRARQHARAATAQRAEVAVVRVDRTQRVPEARGARRSRPRRVDAAYCSASYVPPPDEALVVTMRWPECRFGNVTLWTKLPADLRLRGPACGRNRANTTLEPDGSFRIVIAHEDPGVPNFWLDTEGRPSGSVFWRFFLPEGDIDTPEAEVVKLADLKM